jgi:O-antigen ligase
MASVVVVIGVIGVVALAAVATRFDMLPVFLALALLGVVTAVSFRWPIVALAVFAALIPIEEVALIDGIGTLSRFAGILFAATYGLPRIGNLALGSMPPAAWAYVAWALVSLGWAIDPDTTWAQLPTLVQLFLIALLVADFVARQPNIIRPVLWVYSVSAAATASIGILGYAGLGGDIRATAIQDQNPAQFAGVLLPAVIFGLYEVLNGDRRIFGGAIALVTSIGVIVSGTRGAWVAVGVAVAFFILPQLRPRRRIAAILMTLAIIVLAYQLPGVPDLFAERTGSALSTGGAGRTDIWAVGFTIYGSAPVVGVGYANFPVAYTADAVRATDLRSLSSALLSGRAPHNIVVGTLVELGAIGLLLTALFFGPLVLRRGSGPDAATIQTMLVSLLTLALFLDVLANRKQVWLVIGFAAGLTYAAERIGRMRQQDDHALGSLHRLGLLGRGRDQDHGLDAPTAPGRHA